MNDSGDHPGQPPHGQDPGTTLDAASATPAATVAVDPALGDPGPVSAELSPPPEDAPLQDLAPLVETSDAGEARSGADAASADVVPDVADLPPAELRAVLEGVLFVATRPLSVERLQQVLPGASAGYLEGFLTGLAERYDHENRGWELRHIAGGWQLLTRRALYPWVRQLERKDLPTKLSKSALETLAIVAYRQPITRGAVEDIRGVQCGPVLRQLMDLRLVLVCGRDEQALGRPLLYGTTDSFLSRFGLGRIEDLPRRHEFGA
jgi:segregation and condensation protein B